ncbi:MAG: vWA domain-containing protein [Treponema sp.]
MVKNSKAMPYKRLIFILLFAFIYHFTLISQIEEITEEVIEESEVAKDETEKPETEETPLINKDLTLAKEDTYVLPGNNGGFHLYIRAKKDIKSVLLTETTQDPKLKLHNYAYRDPNFNDINGYEKRILNGEELDISKGLYSLIDSTIEENTPIGKAFHIWIPRIIVYGYSWTRNGELEVVDGTFINIRAFELPYGDYQASFKDNPFVLKIDDIMLNYIHEAVTSFKDITGKSGGQLLYAQSALDVIPIMKRLLITETLKEKELDLMFVLDCTESMNSYIQQAKDDMLGLLENMKKQFSSLRIGLILYKDYYDDYVVKEACVFTKDPNIFLNTLKNVEVSGGGDIPEAVYEGLYLGLREGWRLNDKKVLKKIILIGDAPPHTKPRGRVKKSDVENMANKKGIEINTILLTSMPH